MEPPQPIVRATVEELIHRHEGLLGSGGPSFHVGVVRGRSLSFGAGVPPDRPYVLRARRRGIPAAPRTSGGTGVLHLDGDLLWAIVLPRSDRRVGRDFVHAYGRLGQAVVAGLEASGVPSRWTAAPSLADDYCPLASRGQVLDAAGKVVGAAAQHLTSRALLHQGYVSWEVDRAEVERLFGLGPDASARLGGIREIVPAATPEDLAAACATAFTRELAR